MAADRTPNELADALERSQNSYIAMMADGHRSIIVRSKDDELAECYQLMAEAAVVVRRQGEQLDTLRNAIGELTLDHQPMWASPMGGFTSTAVEGREAVGCVVCFPADGSWPCTTRLIAVDALAAAGGGVPEEGATDEQ